MKRIGDIDAEADGARESTAERLSTALGFSGFSPVCDEDVSCTVRFVFTPSFHSECILTLERRVDEWAFTFRSARIALRRFLVTGADPHHLTAQLAAGLLPPGIWETRGCIGLGQIPLILEDAQQFMAWLAASGEPTVLDGCGVDICRVGSEDRCDEGRMNTGGDRQSFLLTVLTVVQDACDDADASGLLGDVLGYCRR